jgi:transposase
MSLNKKAQEELFTTKEQLPHFLPADDPMMVFSEEIYPAFKDEDFQQYYSTVGRNAISPAFFARVTVLQFRENMSDPQAAEACMRSIDWKIALHLPLEKNTSFHPSSLCRFRTRLLENQALSLIFDKTVQLAQEKGFIKKRTKQRVDATHIISHLNRISTTDLLFRAVKCLVEEIEQKHQQYYEDEIPEYIKERYSHQFSSFGMGKEKQGEKLSEIVEDGLLLKALVEKLPADRLGDLEQLGIMETIFRENVIVKKKEIQKKIFIEAEEIQCPKQTIFDPRDPSIKLGIKRSTKWVGSKCHVVETAEKGKINFITNMIYQRAQEHDCKIHEKIREGNERRGLKPEKMYADTGYISGAAIREYRKNKQELMGYMQADSSNKPDAFKSKRFDFDTDRLKAICPAGRESLQGKLGKEGEIRIAFQKSTCKGCVFFQDCVGKSKRESRGLTLRPGFEFTRERREIQKTETFRDEMRVRAQVEGTISEGTRFLGLRHARYKGEDGHKIQFYMTGAALNVKRLIKAITQGIEIQANPVLAFKT